MAGANAKRIVLAVVEVRETRNYRLHVSLKNLHNLKILISDACFMQIHPPKRAGPLL